MRSEVERSVHGQDEDLEKKNDEAYLGRHPSEFTHLVQRHVFFLPILIFATLAR